MKKRLTAISLIFLILILPLAFAEAEGDIGSSEPKSAPESNIGESEPEPTPDNTESGSQQGEQPSEPESNLEPEQEFIPEEQKELFAEEEIPEGCSMTTTETGMNQMGCDFDSSEFEEFAVSKEMEKCDGRFEIIEGEPACIKKGNAGFIGAECPSQEELDSIAVSCGGDTEYFKDESGCSSVVCKNKDFKKDFDKKIKEKYGDNPLKEKAIMCHKNGGSFISIKGEPKCINRFRETIRIKKDLGAITPRDIKIAGSKLDTLNTNLGKIVTKLQGKKGEVFDEAVERLEAIQTKIGELKEELSTNLTEEEQIGVLVELQTVQGALADVTIGVIEGKMPTEDDINQQMFEQYDEFYGGPFKNKEELKKMVEAEKSALEMVRNCDKYTEVKSFVPPDPEGMVPLVELYGLVDGKCKMVLHLSDDSTITYMLPTEIYTTFRGPEDFDKQGVKCSGNCNILENMRDMHKPQDEGGICMEACMMEDCDGSMFECMEKNMEKCESQCGMKKGPDMESMSREERCIMECVGPDVMCIPGQGGEMSPACEECAQQCTQFYEGPCMTDEQMQQKEQECMNSGEHMEAQVVKGDSGEGYECAVDIECIDRSSEFGDEPAITGGVVKESEGFFTKIINWFKLLFSGSKSAGVSKGNSVEDITEDLSGVSENLNSFEKDLS